MAGRPHARARREALDQADASPKPLVPAKTDIYYPVPATHMFTMRDLVDQCRGATRRAVEIMIEVYENPKTAPAVRLAAIQMLLDRGYGRPHQAIAVTDTTQRGLLNYAALSELELQQLGSLVVKAALPDNTTPQPDPIE